jgi:hypothetical protein
MVISCQNAQGAVPLAQAAQAVRKYFSDANYCGKRVLLIVPDNTRSGPIGEIFQMIFDGLKVAPPPLACCLRWGPTSR